MPADAAWDEEDGSALGEPAVRERGWTAGQAEPLRLGLPALHASLRRLAPDAALFSLSLPAYCADRASLRNVVREVFAEYQLKDQAEGRAECAEPLQYADLAAWQNEALAAPERAKEREYWQQLGLESWLSMRLPNETALPGGPSVEVWREVPADLAAGLRELARSTGSPLERVLFCAWQILLARLLRLDEIVVAAPFAGRSRESLEALPGPSPARCRSGSPSTRRSLWPRRCAGSTRPWPRPREPRRPSPGRTSLPAPVSRQGRRSCRSASSCGRCRTISRPAA